MALDTSDIFERREPTEQDILDIVSPAPSQSSSQYSDKEVAEALKASVAQGFSLEDSLLGAASKFNVPQEQLGRVQNQFFAPATIQPTTVLPTKVAPGVTPAATTTTAQPKTPFEAIQAAIKTGTNTPQTYGQFNITPFSEKSKAIDEYGSVMPIEGSWIEKLSDQTTGYNVTGAQGKTDKGVNYEAALDYDAVGNLQGYTVNYKTGRDSGTEVRYDAKGNIVWSDAYDYSEGWRKPVAMGIGFVAAMYGIPGIGEALGATTAVGQGALGGAFVGGLTSAVSGAEGSDILKGAAVGAASGAVGQGAGQELGKAAGQAVGGDYANIVSGAVKGGVQALPGAIATGDYSQVGIGALTGGATAAGSGAITEALKEYGIKPTQVQAGINIARAISSGNTNAIIGSLGALTNSSDVNIASKAYLAIDALSKGNPIAATAAIIQLGDAVESGGKFKAPAVKTADVGGGPFETSAIFEGTEGGGTSEQDFMGLLGTLGDQPGDYPGQETGPRMFNSSGQMVTAPKGEFLDLPDGRYVDDRGVIFKPDGTLWSPSGQATDPFAATGNIIRGDQKVDVTGEPFRSREDIALDYFYFPEETGKFMGDIGQKIDITGKPIKEDVEDLGQIEVVGKPISDAKDLGKIDIVGKPLKEDVEDLGQIEVVGKPFKEDVEDLGKIDIVGKPIKEDVENLGKIEIVGKPIKDEPPGVIEGPDVIDIVGKPIKEDVEDLGKIEIVGKPIKEDDTGGKPGTIPRVPTIPTTPTTPTTRPRAPAQRQLAAAPQPSQIPDLPKFESFYYQALKYGPQGARQAMADPTDFQGRMAKTKEAMELAIEGAVNENQAEDAVERVMALSKENPEMTVEGLIDLIGRG